MTETHDVHRRLPLQTAMDLLMATVIAADTTQVLAIRNAMNQFFDAWLNKSQSAGISMAVAMTQSNTADIEALRAELGQVRVIQAESDARITLLTRQIAALDAAQRVLVEAIRDHQLDQLFADDATDGGAA